MAGIQIGEAIRSLSIVSFTAMALAIGASDREVSQLMENIGDEEIPDTHQELIDQFRAALLEVRRDNG